ncbi:beta-galactosidase [Streptomyces lasalocidi]
MKHLEDKAKADGITVPLVGNNNGTFNSGDAALDVDGADSYPQGFNCSNPTKWNGVPDISYDHVAGKPLATAEFQGGAFDPWGGPGYDKCAQLINDRFADVFYKQNIAVGATSQSFYMTYGGTNWGWLGMPENYTSYDYGAAIRETRQLDPKYDQDKLIGYFTHAVTP